MHLSEQLLSLLQSTVSGKVAYLYGKLSGYTVTLQAGDMDTYTNHEKVTPTVEMQHDIVIDGSDMLVHTNGDYVVELKEITYSHSADGKVFIIPVSEHMGSKIYLDDHADRASCWALHANDGDRISLEIATDKDGEVTIESMTFAIHILRMTH